MNLLLNAIDPANAFDQHYPALGLAYIGASVAGGEA